GVGLFLGALEVTFLLLSVVFLKGVKASSPWEPLSVMTLIAALGMYTSALGLIGLGLFRARRWGRLHGLSLVDTMRIHSEPTARPQFWLRPHIARLLLPAESRTVDPATARELLAAIERAA